MIAPYQQHEVANHLPHARIAIDQRFTSVAQSSVQIAGPNQRRWALIIGSPNANFTDVLNSSKTAQAVNTAGGGVKLSYTVPTGSQAQITAASFFETTGTGVVSALQYQPSGGAATNIAQFTTSGVFSTPFPLNSGDLIQWNVVTPIAASVSDFTLGITQTQGVGRVTIVTKIKAVQDQGQNLYPGQTPLLLLYDYLGNALREDWFAICAAGTATIPVWDFFEP